MAAAEVADAQHETTAATGTRRALHWLAPATLVALLVLTLVYANPAERLAQDQPPVEGLAFERVRLAPGHVELTVRNTAPDAVTIAQVLVDDAYWVFEASPSATLGRHDAATIALDYPWVEGEPLAVTLLTGSGARFTHEIAVAMPTPTPTPGALLDYAWAGVFIGVLPVAAGMALFPVMTRLQRRHRHALLAFTLGVLGFLAIDTLLEGLDLAAEAPLGGAGLLLGAALVAALAVLGLDRGLRRRDGRAAAPAAALALLVALGIGLHNMGEGLLVGSAFGLGSVGLGTALLAGFAIHNVTEGPAIVAPLVRGGSLPWGRFLALAALAGLPTVLGAWLGAFASTALLAVVFFGLGLGAIVVVLYQVGRAIGGGLAHPASMAAFAVGYLVMLATGVLLA